MTTHEDGTDRAVAERLAQSLARVTRVPTYVVQQGSVYRIQDDADLACYGGRADVVASFEPPPGFPSDDDGTEDGGGPPRAHTRQSIQIEGKISTCTNCKGIHHTQRCPEQRVRLFAPEVWADPELGRELCKMKWRRHAAFVTLLRSVHAAGHLLAYAASYQAFIQTSRPDSDMTITQVLAAWTREMSGAPMPQIKVAA